MKILIGMPCSSGMVPTIMLQSLLMLHKPYPCGFMSVERQRVDKARNFIVLEALKGGFDYLLFVDDDNPIPPDTLEKFIEGDKDVVIAPILSRNDPSKLCAYYTRKIQTSIGKLRLYDHIKKFKDKGPLHKIEAGGTGCMLVKRKVLEELFKLHKGSPFEFGDLRFEKIFVDDKEYDRRTMSEDCEFCERAVDAGFEIYLDERIKPIHLTSMGSVRFDG